MVTISEFSAAVYFIKPDKPITLEDLKQIPEVVKLIDNGNFELKLSDHGIWILRLLG